MKARIKIWWIGKGIDIPAYQPLNDEARKYLKHFLRLPDYPSLHSYYWK